MTIMSYATSCYICCFSFHFISHQIPISFFKIWNKNNTKQNKLVTATTLCSCSITHIDRYRSRLNFERVMTSGIQAYGEPSCWDNRYSKEPGPFDWYQKYLTLAPVIKLYVPHNQPILVVGCGNSALSEGMVDDGGYTDVVNIDISSVVIEAMKNKYRDRPQLKYMNMDVRDMSDFESESFAAVIDKGTLDSILCGNNSRQNATKMLEEIWRVLKDKGVYVLVTYGAPMYRLHLLRDSCLWKTKLHVIEKLASEEKSDHPVWELTKPVPLNDDGSSVEEALGPSPDVHYIYICTKEISANSNINA